MAAAYTAEALRAEIDETSNFIRSQEALGFDGLNVVDLKGSMARSLLAKVASVTGLTAVTATGVNQAISVSCFSASDKRQLAVAVGARVAQSVGVLQHAGSGTPTQSVESI